MIADRSQRFWSHLLLGALYPASLAAQTPPVLDPSRGSAYRTIAIENVDYPRKARRAGMEGDVGVTVSVGPDGHLTQCTVTASSGSAELNAKACEVLGYGFRFHPAKDAAGKPMSSIVKGVFMWRLAHRASDSKSKARVRGWASFRVKNENAFAPADYPPEAVRASEQGDVRVRLSVSSEGEPTACAITVSSGSQSLDDATCRMFMERSRFRPARDKSGVAVPDFFEPAVVHWRLDGWHTPGS